ncbi:MAG: hypothetical protein ABMA14_18660 [Hyphomonadaceae bacterium]
MSFRVRHSVFGIALVVCVAMPVVAEPQTPERLTRPFASHMGADGKLVTSRDATLGNLAVDQYISMGANLAGAGANREMLLRAYKPTLCSSGGVGAMVAYAAEAAVKAMNKEERAGLKARDPVRLEALSIAVLADLDATSAAAIRADEAIGAGVYRDGIDALSLAWVECGFFGLERSL